MKHFSPSAAQIRLAEAVLVAKAHEDLIRPVVEAYETEILAKHQFCIDPQWIDLGECEDQVILDRKKTFLLSDKDAKVFFQASHAARDAAGLKVDDPEFCPLLVAENVRREAEKALLKAMSAIEGLETLGKGFMTTEQRSKAVEITLRLLAPFCGSADRILSRCSTMAA